MSTTASNEAWAALQKERGRIHNDKASYAFYVSPDFFMRLQAERRDSRADETAFGWPLYVVNDIRHPECAVRSL